MSLIGVAHPVTARVVGARGYGVTGEAYLRGEHYRGSPALWLNGHKPKPPGKSRGDKFSVCHRELWYN